MGELVGWTAVHSGEWSGSVIMDTRRTHPDWDASLLARALALTASVGHKPTLAAMGSKKVREPPHVSMRVVSERAGDAQLQRCFKFADLDLLRTKLLSVTDRGTAVHCLDLINRAE